MPSPVGHSLIGLAMGSAYLLPRVPAREFAGAAWSKRWPLLASVALANAPDVDFLPGILSGDLNAYHHVYTHTLGWIFIVAAASWLVWRHFAPRAGMSVFLFLFALLASHLVADWVTEDGRIPYGIMALWPFSDAYYQSPLIVFPSVHKANWSECLELHNIRVVLIEAAICLPLVILALAAKTVSGRGDCAASRRE